MSQGRSVTANFSAGEAPVVIARTPLLPLSDALGVLAAPDPYDALRTLLLEKPLIQQALFTASPSLAAAVQTWCENPAKLKNSTTPLRALAYVLRMASRCTPFGLCAGLAPVSVRESTTLRVGSSWRTVTRPDMGFMAGLAEAAMHGEHRRSITYIANPAALVRGDRLYIADIAITQFGAEAYSERPVTMRHTGAVAYVREITRHARSYSDIVSALNSRFGASEIECERMLDELIRGGVILSELRASPVGDPIEYITRALESIDGATAARLREAMSAAADLDATPFHERSRQSYESVAAAFSEISAGTSATIQIDSYAHFTGALNNTVLSDVAALADIFVRLGENHRVVKYRERFLERYGGLERMVPLLELADANVGLGVPDDLETPDDRGSQRDTIMADIAARALRDGVDEIELTLEELERLAPARDYAVPSLELGFHIAAASPEAIDRGEYRVLPAAILGTMRAGMTAGRFMHLFEPQDCARIKEFCRAAAPDDVAVAELVYAPASARSYNVQIRPAIFDREIRVGIGAPAGGAEIALDDLWVGIDGDRFFLWSKSLQQRVEPLESHVFNTRNRTPNICRILSMVARDGRRTMRGLDWGSSWALPSLPRVRVGRLILSPRQWRLPAAELGSDATAAQNALTRWRREWNLPRYVTLRDGDNLLLLDCESNVCGELLIDQMADGARNIYLQEVLPAPTDLWAEGAGGHHATEFIAFLRSTSKADAAREPRTEPITVTDRWIGGPGSDWLFTKLYLGHQAADDFLLKTVEPLMREITAQHAVDRWFFLRYSDPDHHLRLRVHAETGLPQVREHVLRVLESELQTGRLRRYTLDTYEPEFERYGGVDMMKRVEEFFTQDSIAWLELLKSTGPLSDHRIAAAARSFLPWLRDEASVRAALDAFGRLGKLDAADRASLKTFVPFVAQTHDPLALELCLDGDVNGARLRSLFHMHCNRGGVYGRHEQRAAALLRAALLSAKMRTPEVALGR